MDWLSKNQGKIDCAQRSISVTSEDGSQVVFAPFMGSSHLYALEASTSLEIEKVPVVCEYPDVFPEELPVSCLGLWDTLLLAFCLSYYLPLPL